MREAWARPLGLLLGFAADRLVGDPQRFHPVAGFGSVAAALEKKLYADNRVAGAAYTMTLVGGTAVVGVLTEAATRRRLNGRMLATAVVTWVVLGGRSLEREAHAVHELLAAGNLPGARIQLKRLVGRDTTELDACEIARAVVESVAENTSDAVVAPLVWGAVAGLPGLLGYRAANTLDAMVGHHSTRYETFGWAAARFDDLVNLPGSRLAGLLTLAAYPSRARGAWRAWRRDASGHPSHNAGVVEAAFAGALEINLGGTNRYYGSRVEHRPIMGDGPAAQPHDIGRANRLAGRVGLGAVMACAAATFVIRGGR